MHENPAVLYAMFRPGIFYAACARLPAHGYGFHRLKRVCFNIPEEQVAGICRSVLPVRLKKYRSVRVGTDRYLSSYFSDFILL